MNDRIKRLPSASDWMPPKAPGRVPHPDMPDSPLIDVYETKKADLIFRELLRLLPDALESSPYRRAVVSVCGGSGVGKSGIAAILCWYFQQAGMGCYAISGDHYPHRIPEYNDAERLWVFRGEGLKGLIADGRLTPARMEALRALWRQDADADPARAADQPWLRVYQRAGRMALGLYLGSERELDFAAINGVLAQFKNGAPEIMLKRMGRSITQLWYEPVSFQNTGILILEWTHANSDRLRGVDLPVLLNSTPRETLEYRRARSRDGGTDSPFTTMVLELEQKQLEAQAARAKIIVSKRGELLSYPAYRRLMAEEQG